MSGVARWVPRMVGRAMDALTDIEKRFADAEPRLSLRRRRLIQSMLESPDETYHLSSHELARRYQVDPATIVRAIQVLGYMRFADFSSDLRKHFVARITPYTVMKARASERRSIADHIRQSVERDLENLHRLASGFHVERVETLASQIHQSRRVIVVGVDLAASLATFLAYALRVLGFDAEGPTGSAGNLFHHVKHMTRRDLLIAVSFRRGLRETVDAVLRARARGVPTFGVTDSPLTPIARYCDNRLIAPISSPSFAGSYVAPLAVMNAVIVACSHHNPERTLAILREHEEEYRTGSRWFEEPAQPARTSASRPLKRRRKRRSRVRAR